MAAYEGLVDQYGRSIQKAVLQTEVAGATVTGVRSPMTGYPGDGLDPYRLASILREADQGDPLRYLELAETVEERDLHYAGVLGTRKRSVSQLEITIEAASNDPEHEKHAELARRWLARDELADELFDLLDAVGKGYSFTEIIWDTSEGQWNPSRLEWRDPRWFRFAREDGRTPMLRSDQGDVPLPGGKFITAVMRAKSGLPVRSGLARIVTWAWMFKAFTQRDWAIFTQNFGQPIRIGKYGPNAGKDEKATLFRAVANIAGDCAAIIPLGMEIEFIESKSVGASSDLYKQRSDWLDQQISKATLGQTATTDAIAGGHAVGQEHRLVQEDIERADAKAISAILNRDLIRVWVDLEFGPQKAYPRLKIGRAEQVDIKLTVDSVKELVPMGLKVPTKWIGGLLGAPEPQDGEDILIAPAPPPALGADPAIDPKLPKLPKPEERTSLHFVANDAVDDILNRTEPLTRPSTDQMINVIRALVDRADSLDQVRAELLTLMPDMPVAELASAIRKAMALAELTGRDDLNG